MNPEKVINIKPKEIDIGFKVDYEKLWNLDLPIEEIPISELEYNLDLPYLEKEGTDDWNLTPRDLINQFQEESSHAEKVNQSDSNYPIDIFLLNEKWIIIDGVHRFVKAMMKGSKTIKVRKLTKKMLDGIRA